MSTIPAGQPETHSPAADELEQLIWFLEMIEQKASRQLRDARMASAARNILCIAPTVHEIVISGAGPDGTEMVTALDSAGMPVNAEDHAAAASAIADLPRSDYVHPAGTRIVIAAAAAWWPGR